MSDKWWLALMHDFWRFDGAWKKLNHEPIDRSRMNVMMINGRRFSAEGYLWAIVRADGVVIAQSVGADVSALKAEAA